MRSRIVCLFLVSLVLLSGCTSRTVEAPVPAIATEAENAGVALADLLTKPRAELAKLSDDLAERIRFQERGIRERRTELSLLPEFRLPLVLPVWCEAKYADKVGFSLPPYARENAPDSMLARHLARFGDLEAARKLAEPGDAAQLDAWKYERNYPVEWTRHVALLLHDAQLRIAAGDREGQQTLLRLHQQLRSVLDAKAARGPLGAALLPRGKRVLTEAAVAWRNHKRAEESLQAEQGLRDWGDIPTVQLSMGPGTPRADVERLLGASSKGRALSVAPLPRAFDLLDFPAPQEGARSIVAFFDGNEQLTQVQVTYCDGMAEVFPRPEQLAWLLDERVGKHESAARGGVNRCTYADAAVAWEVFTVPHRCGVGAVMRWHTPGTEPTLPRDFGLVSLDRSFEGNRVRFAPEQRGAAVTVKQPKTLAQVTNPVSAVQPNQGLLQQEAGHDLTARLALRFPVPESALIDLHQLALPLWTTFGPCRFDDVKQDALSYLALVWQDAKTEYRLCLPYVRVPVEWEARDRRTGEQLTVRAAEAAALEQQERQARLATGQTQTRVPRGRERIELGMTREQVVKLLPVGQAVQKRDISQGLLVTLTTEPASTAAVVPRELLVRFDARGQVAELRVRSVPGPVAKGQDPLTELTKRCGAPQEGPAPLAAVWSDLPQPKSPTVLYQWQDDLTTATCQRAGGVTEVVLRDRAAELPALAYLPRGPIGCVLGVARADLLRQFNVTTPTLAEEALVLTPSTSPPYDALLVWFDNDRVSRIVARHDSSASRGPAPKELAQAVSEAWGRDLRTLGWPSRQDLTPQGVLQALGWHDGVTRVRTFWQEQDDGPPRVYTEWRALAQP